MSLPILLILLVLFVVASPPLGYASNWGASSGVGLLLVLILLLMLAGYL